MDIWCVAHVLASVACDLPTISVFYGIVIRMFVKDHPPPHFHALYGGRRTRVAIATGEPIGGELPPRAARLVREWTDLHRPELEANWQRAEQMRPLRANRAAPVIAPRVHAAVPLRPYVVRVVFADGEVRDVDIEPLLDGAVFQPLRDPALFEQVRVDEYNETIVWPNGADLDPDVLYGIAEPATEPAPRVSIPQRA